MRFYSFTHWMLRPIQQGIQPGHAAVELFVKYDEASSSQLKMLWDWAQNHKTFICLNGGNTKDLTDLLIFLMTDENPYPWSAFHEDSESLNESLTSIGIVLPPGIYETVDAVRTSNEPVLAQRTDYGNQWVARYWGKDNSWVETSFTDWEAEMIFRIAKSSLAT